MIDDLRLDLHPVPERAGWYRTAAGRWEALQARVLEVQNRRPLGRWQLVCGLLGDDEDGHAIYAIDGISPVDVARGFATGSHNASETDRVCEQLARVFEVAPFRPYFADAAGYKCRFERPISREQGAAVEQILTVGLEGYHSEWSGVGPLVADAVVAENGLRLWCD
jgi:hypothetical protein